MKSYISGLFLTFILAMFVCQSCTDELPFNNTVVGEGESLVSASVTFESFAPALASRSGGEIIHDISDMQVFIYDEKSDDEESQLVTTKYFSTADMSGWSVNQNGNTGMPSDVSSSNGEHQAETSTPKAKFSIPLKFGRYHIYVVANLGHLSPEDYSTPAALKNIVLTWNQDNIAANNQMFGYFTPADNQESTGFSAPLVTINKPSVELHSWIKRAASKVTVAVDGSGLNEGVKVWIKTIQIMDIPSMCWLGQDNTAAQNLLIDGGEKIVVSSDNGKGTAESVGLVTKNQSWPTTLQDAHTRTAQALYFYENMQGEGQDKAQRWSTTPAGQTQFPNGNSPTSGGYKDGKRDGTYVQVIGYYKNSKGEGPIIYRFMLGKNITTNYDAERNHHFKLTLKLRNNANDNDWHIVYDQEPDIKLLNPYFISYVYDETMDYPFTVVGGELVGLRTEIPENDVNKNSWHPIPDQIKDDDIPFPYWKGQPDKPGPWNGFLSVRKTQFVSFGSVEEGYEAKLAKTYTYNKEYYTSSERGKRTYLPTSIKPTIEGVYVDSKDGNYKIINTGGGEYEVSIPMFTRARVMVAQTAYTGNNPYVAYQRKAQVNIIADIKRASGEIVTKTKTLTLIQARRVVNPKGIWRSGNCTNDFHVQMKDLPHESATEFENLYSIGPWRAEIEYGDWFDIVPTPGISVRNPDGSISGVGDQYPEKMKDADFDYENIINEDDKKNPGRVIDFTFRPKGTTSTPRGGIIKIYYHNYSCIHRIFVRQGYDPVSFTGSNTKWHTCNMISATEEAADPATEGSYFRRYNLDLPIAASNNTKAMSPNNGSKPNTTGNTELLYTTIKNGANRNFTIVGSTDKKKWNKITTTKSKWDKITINGKTCRIATKADYEALIGKTGGAANPNTMYGFGVIYSDNVRETLNNVDEAYATRGMRGVFLCDKTTGTQIFFPIGASGYGRFKQQSPERKYNRLPAKWAGVIQYANRYQEMPDNLEGNYGFSKDNPYVVRYKPLFWDLYRREGAIYWIRNDNNNQSGYGLDINYYTFDFAISTTANIGIADWEGWAGGNDPSGTDALQIRLVE